MQTDTDTHTHTHTYTHTHTHTHLHTHTHTHRHTHSIAGVRVLQLQSNILMRRFSGELWQLRGYKSTQKCFVWDHCLAHAVNSQARDATPLLRRENTTIICISHSLVCRCIEEQIPPWIDLHANPRTVIIKCIHAYTPSYKGGDWGGNTMGGGS